MTVLKRRAARPSAGLAKPLLILFVLWLASRYVAHTGILFLLAAVVVWKLAAVLIRRLKRRLAPAKRRLARADQD